MNKLLMLLIICLSVACNKPQVRDTEQCMLYLHVVDDAIQLDGSYCACRQYRFSEREVGPQGDSHKEPLVRCQKLIGWTVNDINSDYTDVAFYWEQVREWAHNLVNNDNKELEE